jgi:hypothetical protein
MQRSKAMYRAYFADVVLWLKMNYFLKRANVDQPNFSRFMKGEEYDYLISVEKLEALYKVVHEKIT